MYALRRWCTAIWTVLSALALMTHGATIKFDQSQTGDYNLQIHLKNIELYAVFDDSGGSEDDYGDLPDYTDPTEAPSRPPSATSTSTTTKSPASYGISTASAVSTPQPPPSAPSAPSALLDPYSPSNSDKIVQMVEALIASNGNTSDLPTEPPAVAANTSPPSPQPQPSLQASPSAIAASVASATASPTTGSANRKCGPGYFRDPMGRCRRIRKPHLPFLQMVHTPGVIKSFQPQQRTADEVGASKN
ncbi:Hypothetical protein CINCED_3A013280 [Cinara cedri]|uniref:Insect cuticle protein n=1 Tax=Cinara cedri TaxID=506608 RepID=A0A5E4M172_9HEMI|nr:Hypothetical protein CINCED_3A013280 [Cinara cedri]